VPENKQITTNKTVSETNGEAVAGLSDIAPFPVTEIQASVRMVFDLSNASEDEINDIPDYGVSFQNIDRENHQLILVIDIDDKEVAEDFGLTE